MFQPRYNLFGATADDVLEYFPGASYADAATIRRTLQAGCSQTSLVVDSTIGLTTGSMIEVRANGLSEIRQVASIADDTHLTLSQALASVPAAGDLLNNGPEFIRRELVRAEAFVVSKLPERYRRLLRRVRGEVIVASAQDGQTTASLGLPPAGSVALYKNVSGLLLDLMTADELPPGTWQANNQAITFDPPLAEGDTVLAAYDVAIGSLQVLQTLLVDLATYRVGRRLVGRLDSVTPEWLVSFRDRGEQMLTEIFAGERGIDELDALHLYEDWQRTGSGIRCGSLEKN